MNYLCAFLLLQAGAQTGAAEAAATPLELPAIFGDHMVLQRGKLVPIWGRGGAGTTVQVRLGMVTEETTVSDAGTWSVWLEDLPAGGPYELEVIGRERLRFRDVWVGEVWLGVGQSSMALGVRACQDGAATVAAADHPKLRMFRELSGPADTPQWKGAGQWEVCTPESVPLFSATLYFFGVELLTELDVPIGLINTSLGGTPLQSWIRAEALRAAPELKSYVEWVESQVSGFEAEALRASYERELAEWKKLVAEAQESGKKRPTKPVNPLEAYRRKGGLGGLYHGKLAPLAGYGLSGVILSQGDSNGNPRGAAAYEHLLRLFVRDLRKAWRRQDLPVVWTQLPCNDNPLGRWPEVRDAMRRALAVPDTGMVVTLDLEGPDEINPKQRPQVCQRLARWALVEVYGRDGVARGPLFAASEARGSALHLSFTAVEQGLSAPSGKLEGFELLDEQGAWHPAQAKIVGQSVVVEAKGIAKPQAARYAWNCWPKATLYNSAGLPASPFTTLAE